MERGIKVMSIKWIRFSRFVLLLLVFAAAGEMAYQREHGRQAAAALFLLNESAFGLVSGNQ